MRIRLAVWPLLRNGTRHINIKGPKRARCLKQRGVHRTPRTIAVRHRHRTEYDAPSGPGSIRRRTATAPPPHAGTDWVRASVPVEAPPRHLIKAHMPRSFCLWSYNISPWQGQTHNLKNGRGFTWICAFHHTAFIVRYRTDILCPYHVRRLHGPDNVHTIVPGTVSVSYRCAPLCS
jgi:hypothetical protein